MHLANKMRGLSNMKEEDIVKINGRNYSIKSGNPINENRSISSVKTSRQAVKSNSIHSSIKKSQTLMRKSVTKPANTKSRIARTMDIAKSARVSRFAPNPIIKKPLQQLSSSSQTTSNPILHKVNKSMEMIKNSQPARTLAEIKEEAISKTIVNSKPTLSKKKKSSKIKKITSNRYLLTLFIIGFVAISIYVSYQYIPAVSIRIAASQAGIDATYPTYTPDDYGVYGPAISQDKKVLIKYKQKNGDKMYTISQSYSNWDSSALYENLVKTWSDKSPNTTRVNGLTVYSTSNYENVAWVNRGILFTIIGNADLDSRKIERIVSSM